MLTNCCLFQQIGTIFSTTLVKNLKSFIKYFQSSFQFLHGDTILLWPPILEGK